MQFLEGNNSIVGRGFLTLLSMKTPYIAFPYMTLFKFCPPLSLLPPTPTPLPTVHSVILFLCLNVWLHQVWCDILLNDMYTCQALALSHACFMQQGVKFTKTKINDLPIFTVTLKMVRCFRKLFNILIHIL